jgi:mannose-6-phosphate isomerase-like protein (cupin superfamily)
MEPITLSEKLEQIHDLWQPHVVADVNGQHVKLAKVQGEFVWHHHDDADEFFLVLSGRLTIRFRDGDVTLGPGEAFVVPRGVDHQPVATGETHILLFEPAGTRNTGNVREARTQDTPRYLP